MVICKSNQCTGCGMCADACPKACVSIGYDQDGFYQSQVDDSACIGCRRCVQVCPGNHPNHANPIQRAYKARRIDKVAAAESTSGGIAAALSEYIIQNGGVVAGCGYDNTLGLKHSLAFSLEELEKFKGSKYLQSNTVGIYRGVREQLQAGKQVMFVGTPCQVSALNNFLGKAYDHLYTVDFVCHGVPSQAAFNKYLEFLNPTDSPNSIRFRNKTKGYRNKNACFELQIEYSDKTFGNTTADGFYGWFASSLSVRESCYQCSFVSVNRGADITLADYIGNDLDDADDQIGVSMVFVNSQKGSTLFEAIGQEVMAEPREVNDTVNLYDRLTVGSQKPSCRKSFFKDLSTCDYKTLHQKYTIEKILPCKIVRRYYALKRKIRKVFAK